MVNLKGYLLQGYILQVATTLSRMWNGAVDLAAVRAALGGASNVIQSRITRDNLYYTRGYWLQRSYLVCWEEKERKGK